MGVYGRPNVGKSTLVNALLGMKRMIVSPIAGTTVDPVDTHFERDGTHFCLVDTAGIRRRSKTEEGIEVLSVVQAIKTIERVDVAIFVIDGYEGVTDQDEKVAGRIAEAGRPTIVVVNKWDLCRTDKEEYAERFRETVPFLDYAPVIFACAEKGQGLEPIFDLVPRMLEERMRTAPTGELNRIVQGCVEKVSSRGVKAYYCLQVSKNPPTISIQVNDPGKVHYSLEGHIRNELRSHFGWMGSPLKVQFRGRSGKQRPELN
jgi:GTP-binding protein